MTIEFDRCKAIFVSAWEEIHRTIEKTPEQSVTAANTLIASQPVTTALAFAVARLDASELFASFKRLLEFITRASERKAGYARVFTVPHLQAGYLYMASSVLAFHRESWDTLAKLLTESFEWYYESGRPIYSQGFQHPQFFHPEAIDRDGPKCHDFYRERLSKDREVAFPELADDSLLNEYLKCQFLMSCRAAQLSEQGRGQNNWPDFGRFHGFRVSPLLDRIHSDAAYAQGVLRAFSETSREFLEKFPARLELMSGAFGNSNYFWTSIESWEPR